jgi:hypothetical protein
MCHERKEERLLESSTGVLDAEEWIRGVGAEIWSLGPAVSHVIGTRKVN